MIKQFQNSLWVDQHVLTLRDGETDWDGSWTNEDSFGEDGVGVALGVVSMTSFTRAAGHTPVIVELHADAPDESDLDDYNGVVEVDLSLPSGRLVLANENDEIEVAVLEAGIYRARVYYGDDDTCHYDEDDGANHVRVALFPGPSVGLRVLKAMSNQDDPIEEYTGARSEAQLLQWLGAESTSHRCLATVALLRMGKLDLVAASIESAPPTVGRLFASALGFAGPSAWPFLLDLAKRDDADLRTRTVQSLRMLRTEAAVELVGRLAKDDADDTVRRAAEDVMEYWEDMDDE